MNNQKIQFGIKLKLILYISSIVIAISGVLTWFFLDRMISNLEKEVEKRGRSEAIDLSLASKYGVLTEDSEILNALIQGRLSKADVVYVMILDATGAVLASSDPQQVGTKLADPVTVQTLASMKPEIQLYSATKNSPVGPAGTPYYDASAPVMARVITRSSTADEDPLMTGEFDDHRKPPGSHDGGSVRLEKIGTVRVGLSLQSTYEKKTSMILLSILFTGLVVLISIAISLVVARATVNPLIDMANVATQIADGDLNKRVSVTSSDEVGLMAKSFNLMATKLRASFEGLETKIKERTIALEEAGSKTEAIIQNMVDGLVALDSQRKVFLANGVFEKMTGKSDLVGVDIATVSNEFDKIAVATLDTGENSSTEITIHGDLILKISSSLIIHNDATIGVLLLLRDITVEKEIDRMKTDFISNVSHELRTPLTSILGFASNAAGFFSKDIMPVLPTDDKKIQRRSKAIEGNLSIIVSEGGRLTRLINDVLDISKMEQGKVEWDVRDVDILEICQQGMAAVAGYPKSERVEIRYYAPVTVSPVKGDHDRLIQVITNLMSNALKFTDVGSITLRVEPMRELVKVSVIDTGPGIDQHNIANIFEKFKQVGSVLTNKAQGTGLGLPICKQIVEQLGGTVDIESKLGHGSCFSFTIPYSDSHDGDLFDTSVRRAAIEQVIEHLPTTADSESPTILIADDDRNIRVMLGQALTEQGYQFIEAENGLETLEILKEKHHKVSLVLLDIMMPKVDGYDVLSAIKTNETLAHIPVIVISAYHANDKAYRLGSASFLRKPIDHAELNATIATLLKKPQDKNVLIIEDDNSIVNLIRSALEDSGYMVNVSDWADDGVEVAKKCKSDIIMIDLNPTHINDGIKLIERLRSTKALASTHIVLIADDKNENALKTIECLKQFERSGDSQGDRTGSAT